MKVGKIEYEKYIVPVGLVVGGYFLLKHFNLFGSSAGAANNASTDAATTANNNAAIAQETNKGGFPTLSAATTAGLANTIYNAGVSSPVDMDTIQQAMIQANTTLDILNVAQAFGTKQAGGSFSACSLFGIACQSYNLAGFCRATLDNAHINTINNYFADQGINYQI